MKKKRRGRRRNPAHNPSTMVTTLVSVGAAIASIVVVSAAMQSRRNTALTVCSRLGTLMDEVT